MLILFWLASAVAILATLLAITRTNALHGLLYLIISLLAVALLMYLLGAAFAAALEVIVYAGSIVVMFVIAVMVMNMGAPDAQQSELFVRPSNWIAPSGLIVILIAELIYVLARTPASSQAGIAVLPAAVGAALYGPYLLGVELASMLMLAGLVGAYHLGKGR